ncbi:MAG: GtrA family protein [Acidimicrobiaceae bacterium]|nr:GtrA family protein [Acidimicrobiaceae bacterium]MCY4281142.1 GtrA family protein [Acidimicrobiaceae bacterium]MCY4294366.1 GtrA family protein [Acidimicrobiaceae bacterium]
MSSATAALRRLRSEHGLKALRYCAVSAVNVGIGSGVLAICHGLLDWPAVSANLAAWLVGTAPAYVMSRAWVWQRRGPHRLGGEVLTFWVLALVGLAVSSLAVATVERLADATPLVVAASLAAYGIVWVARYIFLDQVLWSVKVDGKDG